MEPKGEKFRKIGEFREEGNMIGAKCKGAGLYKPDHGRPKRPARIMLNQTTHNVGSTSRHKGVLPMPLWQKKEGKLQISVQGHCSYAVGLNRSLKITKV